MEKIRVENLRCLNNYDLVEIKPVTLLVGANSSGKSTFLRLFPLLRQSVETRTLSGLLLNEGDANFGFFSDAIRKDADPQELSLEFSLILRTGLHQGYRFNRFLLEAMPVHCKLVYVKRRKDPRYPNLRAIHLTLGNTDPDIIKIETDEEGAIIKFEVNDFRASSVVTLLRLRVGRGIVPTIFRGLKTANSGHEDISEDEDIDQEDLFEKALLSETKECFHSRTSEETRLALLRELKIGSPASTLVHMKNMRVGSWKQYVQQNWQESTPKFKHVRNVLLAKLTSDILVSLNVYISDLANSVHYFAPVRATVERDYTSRDVQVSNVDPRGINVAMVLASLDNSAQLSFRHWMRKHFGFEIYPKSVSDGARIALWMKEQNSGAEFNLADMGFGFSQMLPFLVEIWSLTEREPTRQYRRYLSFQNRVFARSLLFAIEQPELHLHPALQARLADLFVATAKLGEEKNIPIRFMLETHSPTIIERIGQLVEAQKIGISDVQILLFERNGAGSASVRQAVFDEDGVLRDWPFGFLSAPPPSAIEANLPLHPDSIK